MNDYHPDKWMMVRVTDTKTKNVHYRIFGSWFGGYVGSDSWRLNSGIEELVVKGKQYCFIGTSGSEYLVHKDMYGASSYGYGVLLGLIEKNARHGIHIETLDSDTNFANIAYK